MHLAFTQALLFLFALVGLVALVPLGVWLGTGSRLHAWRAARSFGMLLGAVVALGALGALIGLIAGLTP